MCPFELEDNLHFNLIQKQFSLCAQLQLCDLNQSVIGGNDKEIQFKVGSWSKGTLKIGPDNESSIWRVEDSSEHFHHT